MAQRQAIVTGGSTGIGRACAVALAKSGHDVAITYAHGRDEAEKTAGMIRDVGRKAVIAELDLSEPTVAAAVVDQMVSELGGLDTLVNNAGMMIRKRFDQLDLDMVQKIFNVNVFGAMLVIRRGLHHMLQQGRGDEREFLGQAEPRPQDAPGRVIVITSVHEHFANPTDVTYTMTKHALGAMVKGLALELGRLNVTVNAVAPGEIATPMNDMTADEAADIRRPAMPMRSVGTPDDVAQIVDFLARPDTNFVTGVSWLVDGGFQVATPLAHSSFRDEFVE